MNLTRLNIPLEIVIDGAQMILLSVTPYYAYQDGKKTDAIQGYRYNVVENKAFDKFSVKIPSNAPKITQEQIDSSKSHFIVDFKDAIARPYRTQTGDYELSINATDISIIK